MKNNVNDYAIKSIEMNYKSRNITYIILISIILMLILNNVYMGYRLYQASENNAQKGLNLVIERNGIFTKVKYIETK